MMHFIPPGLLEQGIVELTILAPSNLVAIIDGNNHVLTWTDNSNNEDGFRVEVSFDGGTTWETKAEIAADLETLTVPTLDPFWENVALLVEPVNALGSTSFTDTGPDSFTIGDFSVATVSDTVVPFPGEKAIHLSGETGYLEIAKQVKVTNWFIESWTLDIFFYNADASGWVGWNYFDEESIPILWNSGSYINFTRYFGFGPDSTGNLKFYYWIGAQERVNTSLACSNQTWHHARLVHEKGVGIHIYLDGVHHNGGTATAVVNTPPFDIVNFPTYINCQTAEAGITNGYVAGIRVTSGIARSTGATHDAVTLPYVQAPVNTVSLPNQADVLAWLDPADPTYMWQDIAKSIPVTSIGDPIAVWADKLGSGREWTQSDNARRPTWEGTYVRFQAAWLIGPDLSAFTTGSLVARVGVDDRGNVGGSGGGLFHFTSMNDSNSAGHYALNNSSGAEYSAFCNTVCPAVGVWNLTDIGDCLVRHTATYRHNGTNLTVRVNGTEKYNNAVTVGNLGDAPIIGSVRRLSVISSWAIADAKIIGGGLVLYSTALSDTDLATAESFVQNTYMPPIETSYRVIATAGAVDSDPSNVAILGNGLMAPSDLVALISGNEYDLTWTDNAINETGYRVECTEDDGATWVEIASLPANTESYTVPAPTFDPNSISDLISWLDASVTSAMQDPLGVPVVTSDGDVFNKWAETIANTPTANHWRAASTSNDLKWYASINGFPAVESLRPSSPYIQTQTAAGGPQQLPSGEQQTIFSVSTNTTSNDRGAVIGTSGSFSSNDGGIVLVHDRRDSSPIQGFAENTFGGFAVPTGTPVLNNGDIKVGAMRLDKAGNEVQSWTNGTANTPATLSGTYWQNGRQGYLGEAFPGYTADIFIHETLVYDRALTDEEVNQVNDYLKAKYGL